MFIYNKVFQSALMCYTPKSLRKKYIPLRDFIVSDVISHVAY